MLIYYCLGASNSRKKDDMMHEFAMKARNLEINPRSPLIQGLLKRVEQLPRGDGEEKDEEAEAELKEVVSILIDGALVRSGFEVPDTNEYEPSLRIVCTQWLTIRSRFFSRVDRVLRRSLGVSETASTDDTVKPAPPIDPEEVADEEELEGLDFSDIGDTPGIHLPDHMKDQMQVEMEEIDDDGNPVVKHDEL